MVETVNSEWLKNETELAYILRWEEDGGAVSETVNPLPQFAVINAPQSMDVAGESLLFEKNNHTQWITKWLEEARK